MKKLRNFLLTVGLTTVIILFNTTSVSAKAGDLKIPKNPSDPLIKVATWVSDTGQGSGISKTIGSTGSKAYGGDMSELDYKGKSTKGYYYAQERVIDLGRSVTPTKNQNVTVYIGMNHANIELLYSNDGVHWTSINTVKYKTSDKLKSSEWADNVVSQSSLQGKTFRYIKAKTPDDPKFGFSAIDDLAVTVKSDKCTLVIHYKDKKTGKPVHTDTTLGNLIPQGVFQQTPAPAVTALPISGYTCENPDQEIPALVYNGKVEMTYYYKKPDTTPKQNAGKAQIYVNNIDVYQGEVNDDGVLVGGRKMLKVEGHASSGPNYEYDHTNYYSGTNADGTSWSSSEDIYVWWHPPITFSGSGKGVTNPMDTGTDTMSGVHYYDDTENTTDCPSLNYSSNNTLATLNWGEMQDPYEGYGFNISSIEHHKDSGSTTLADTAESLNPDIKFASGYKDFNLKIYRVSGNGAAPTSSPLVDQTGDFYSYTLNMFETWWYYAECTMFDYNGNPSGTAKVWFSHKQPALFTDLNVSVTAIKDIDWEKATYPFNYGFGVDHGSSEYVVHGHGDSYSKFPLGLAYKFNNKNIAQGYTVNYNIQKESKNALDNLNIRYSFTGEQNQVLSAKKDGEFLDYCDSSQGTHYTNNDLSPNELATLNDNEAVYLKHFVPANATFYDSSGNTYSGFVTVNLSFESNVDGQSFARLMPLYTINTNENALDDIGSNKQR